MKNNSLLIMAGGASSRMKKSLAESNLNDEVLEAAKNLHKSLIPLDHKGRPLLYFLLRNAQQAGYQSVYLITSKDNGAFVSFLQSFKKDFRELEIRLAIQYLPPNQSKPLGTADAVQQCLDQYPELQKAYFTVCNGDNLYSAGVMGLLRQVREASHATIGYKGSSLGFDDERLSKFAVMHIDAMGYLQQIIEKPKISEMDRYRDSEGDLSISMNIFNFSGIQIYPFLEACPLHPVRKEKELPEAVRAAIAENPHCMACFSVNEKLPDLTTAEDIKNMNSYL